MIFRSCEIAGARLVEPEPHEDDRGRFLRAWCLDEFAANGIPFVPLQANMGHSRRRGTIRGLHYQVAPALEAKLVRCTRGSLFDVVVDLRPESPSYCAWFGTILTPGNAHALYLPEGCAHGCQALEDETEFLYLTSAVYSRGEVRGARYDDAAFGIEWPLPATLVSEQDRAWPRFEHGQQGVAK